MQKDHDIKVLYITGGVYKYHDLDKIAEQCKAFLSDAGMHVTVTRDLDDLLPENVKEYDVIMCYSMNLFLSRDHEDALLKAIIGSPWGNTGKPKGFVGIHGAADTFMNSSDYVRMLGGKLLTHPPVGNFSYSIENKSHPVMSGVEDFSIESELYLMEVYPPFETLLSCDYRGFKRPVAWVKPYGLGRVFYFALGHSLEEVSNKEFQKIVVNGVKWASETSD